MTTGVTGSSKSILTRFPYNITPATGVWIFNIDTGGQYYSIAVDNCTLPNESEPPFIATWGIYKINWALCDWSVTFGLVTPPFPSFLTILGLLTGPQRIPGPCGGGGGGGGTNIYNTSDSLTGNRVVDFNNNNLSFDIVNTETFVVREGVHNTDMLELKSTESRLENFDLVLLRSAGGTVETIAQNVEINVVGGTLEVTGIPNSTKPDLLYFDVGTNAISYGSTPTSSNIYTTDGTVLADRTVEQGDKKLAFKISDPGSTFSVSKDGTTFPTNALRAAIIHVDSDNFLSTGDPGLVIGRQDEPGTNGGKSTAMQISGVTGQRALLITSIDEPNNKISLVMVNDDLVNIQSAQATISSSSSNSQVVLDNTGVLIDGGSSAMTVKIDNILYDPTSPSVLHIDTGTKSVTYGEAPNIYTTDGQLNFATPAVRTVDVNGSTLFISDTAGGGGFDVNVSNVDILCNDITIAGPSIKWNGPPQNNALDQVIVRDTVTNQLYQRTVESISSLSRAVFSVSTQNAMPIPQSFPSPTSPIPTPGYPLEVNVFRGNYDLSSGDLDLTTGIYTPSVTTIYNISFNILFVLPVTPVPSLPVIFYNITSNDAIWVSDFGADYGTRDTVNPSFSATLTAGQEYQWKMNNPLVGDDVIVTRALWSINKV
jgi:hypothetical protein